MAKRKSAAKDFIEIVSLLPWWAGVAIAVTSFVGLHMYATPIAPQATGTMPISALTTQSIYKALATVGQYLIPVICLVGAALSAHRQKVKHRLVDQVTSSDAASALNDMSWQEFESLVSEAFRLRVFRVAQRGGAGPDGGVDLVLSKGSEIFLVQCKQWKALKVGVDVVRELYGVMAAQGAAGGFVVTSGTYTTEAIAFSSGRNVQLIDGERLFGMLKQAKASQGSKSTMHVPTVETPEPACPSCGAAMVKREATRGANAGNAFWGCSTYPRCKGTRNA